MQRFLFFKRVCFDVFIELIIHVISLSAWIHSPSMRVINEIIIILLFSIAYSTMHLLVFGRWLLCIDFMCMYLWFQESSTPLIQNNYTSLFCFDALFIITCSLELISLVRVWIIRNNIRSNSTYPLKYQKYNLRMKWGRVCLKQLSRPGTSNCIQHYLWDAINFPFPRYLLLPHKSTYTSFRMTALV